MTPQFFPQLRDFFSFRPHRLSGKRFYDPCGISVKLPALWAVVTGVGRTRPHPFLLLRFRRTEKRPDTPPNGLGSIRTPPPPCEATNRPTGGNAADNGCEMRLCWKSLFSSASFALKEHLFIVITSRCPLAEIGTNSAETFSTFFALRDGCDRCDGKFDTDTISIFPVTAVTPVTRKTEDTQHSRCPRAFADHTDAVLLQHLRVLHQPFGQHAGRQLFTCLRFQ